jgi:DinB superfamily
VDDLLPHVLSVLSTTPERWNALAHTVQLDLLSRPPAPGEWSALDCLRHLLASEREVFPVRVAALMSGRDIDAYDPEVPGATSGPEDPADLVAELETLRGRSMQTVAALTPDDLGRAARHAELGPVTLEQLLNEWAAHDLMHTVQAERAIMQPFIAGSGPWYGYFADHEARPGHTL